MGLLDAIIVGAGPVGCHVAAGLAGRGHQVLVIEEHDQIGLPARCTGLIGEQAFARFDLPGAATQRIVKSIRIYGPDGTWFHHRSERPLARVVSRPQLDAALAARAAAAGAGFLLGRKVLGAQIEPKAVALTLAGSEHPLRARSLVIATGARGNLTEQLGLGRLCGYLFGVQVETEVREVEEVEVYLGRELSPGSFAWVVPTIPGRARIGLSAYGHPRERLALFLRDRRLQLRLVGPIPPPTVAPIPLGTLPTTVADRVLVVGEAAGQVKTTTGGGVYYGLLAAEIAAEVLGQALAAGDLGRASLARYEATWRQLLGREIEYGLRLRRLARRLDDATLAFFLNLANRDGIKYLVGRLASFDWHASLVSALLEGPLRRSAVAVSSLD